MTFTLDYQAEPYSQLGNISARGIGKILGTPKHDRMRIVIRETVQNTWDAKVAGTDELVYRVRLRTLSDPQVDSLWDGVFYETPSRKEPVPSIEEALGRDEVRVLEIIDFGTSGLGGPLRADKAGRDGEPTDFVDFVRNIGSPRDKAHGGGTYGYGKASLFVISRCRTICIHSLGMHNDRAEERFIASRLGEPHSLRGKKYTGRHWWGREANDGFVDPVLDDEAAKVAKSIGLPARSSGDFGTSIMVLDPDLEHRTPEQATQAVIETLLWNFWPKMDAEHGARIRFEVELNGKSQVIPAVDECPPLSLCAEAMRKLRSGDESEDVFEIRSQRPKKRLGSLSICRDFRHPRREFDTGDDSEAPLVSSHIALMRPAELVVKYLRGPAMPSDVAEYAGLFICDDDGDVEQAFAAAEPPAHDDWIPDNLTGRERTIVNVALREVRQRLKETVARYGRTITGDADQHALGSFADSLGGILLGLGGTGVGPETRSPGRGAGSGGDGNTRGRGRVSAPEPNGFRLIDGIPCACFLTVLRGDGTTQVRLRGEARVLLEGGGSTDKPAGVGPPSIMGWYTDDDRYLGAGSELDLKPLDGDVVIAAVAIPDHCAVGFQVQSEQPK